MNGSTNIKKGLNLQPLATSVSVKGDLAYNSSTDKMELYNGAVDPLVNEAKAATLTNKSIDASSNTITNIVNAAISSGAAIAYSKLALSNSIVNADIASGAAIAYSKLSLGTSILNADISASAGIVYSKLNLSGSILNADINSGAAIVYSKLSLSNSIVNADIASGAAIAYSKLAALTINQVAISNGSGVITTEATLAKSRGGSGQDNSSLTFPSTGTLATLAGSETFSNKTFSDAPTLTQIATPGSPSASNNKIYAKSDGNLYILNSSGAETRIGSSGVGGVNFIALDSAYKVLNDLSSYNAEVGVGNWAAYADAAGTAPVDMTGGSPVTTITRTTTAGQILNGTASLLLTKDAANRQGEGVSCVCYIPPAYATTSVQVQIPFKLITGTFVQNDFKIYAYDVTNSILITPFNNDIVGSQGMLNAVFPVSSTTTQIRIGIHVASTSATAVTIAFDDVQVSPAVSALGMAGSDTVQYTPTMSAGFGTATSISAYYRRLGDMLEVTGTFTTGTVAASLGSITLPAGLSIDTAKITASNTTSGNGSQIGIVFGAGGSNVVPIVTATGTSTTQVYTGNLISTATMLTPSNVTSSLSSSIYYAYKFTVPISGWSSNVTMAQSSTFKISNYLAGGSRVTGAAPTALGQYRSYLRNSSAATFTETNGTPTALPNTTDGIKIYTSGAFGSADPSGSPSKYEIFVGKNKNVQLYFYKSAGRTGGIDTSPFNDSSAGNTIGLIKNYDPTTGILTLTPNTRGTATALYVGVDTSDGTTMLTSSYFDIIVSENALAVGIQTPRSEVIVDTGNGHGATNTKIRRFTNIQKNTGTAITYADSSTLGGSFTINEDGIYTICYNDFKGTAYGISITVNDSALTTSASAPLTYAQGARALVVPAGGITGQVCWSGFVGNGSIVRAHDDGTCTDAGINNMFSIVKVSN